MSVGIQTNILILHAEIFSSTKTSFMSSDFKRNYIFPQAPGSLPAEALGGVGLPAETDRLPLAPVLPPRSLRPRLPQRVHPAKWTQPSQTSHYFYMLIPPASEKQLWAFSKNGQEASLPACLPGGSSITSFKQRFAMSPLRPAIPGRALLAGGRAGKERAFLGAAGLGVASPPASWWLHTIARWLVMPGYDLRLCAPLHSLTSCGHGLLFHSLLTEGA